MTDKDVLQQNLKIDNVVSLSCSLWSKEQLDYIRSCVCEKNDRAYVMNDENPIKGAEKSIPRGSLGFPGQDVCVYIYICIYSYARSVARPHHQNL